MIRAVMDRTYTVHRETTGAYTDGVYSAELEEVEVIGILQEASPDDLRAYPAGQDDAPPTHRFICRSQLYPVDPDADKADRLIDDDGEQWEVVQDASDRARRPTWRFPLYHYAYLLRRVDPPVGGDES